MKRFIFRRKYVLLILALLCFGLVTATAEAALLDYQFYGTAYGEVDGVLFNSVDFAIHIQGDSANVQTFAGWFESNGLTGSITLSGGDLGTVIPINDPNFLPDPLSGSFVDDLYVWCDNQFIGFGTGLAPDDAEQLDFYIPLAATYDLTTPFGPFAAESIYNYLDTGTAFGALLFDNVLDAQFRTTAVPIPTSLMLLGSGLIGLLGIRRRFER